MLATKPSSDENAATNADDVDSSESDEGPARKKVKKAEKNEKGKKKAEVVADTPAGNAGKG